MNSASVTSKVQDPEQVASWWSAGSGWSRTWQPVLVSAGLVLSLSRKEWATEKGWGRRRLSGRGWLAEAGSYDPSHGFPQVRDSAGSFLAARAPGSNASRYARCP